MQPNSIASAPQIDHRLSQPRGAASRDDYRTGALRNRSSPAPSIVGVSRIETLPATWTVITL